MEASRNQQLLSLRRGTFPQLHGVTWASLMAVQSLRDGLPQELRPHEDAESERVRLTSL